MNFCRRTITVFLLGLVFQTKTHCIASSHRQVNTQSDMMKNIKIHLHADAAHHLMRGGQVAVSGESSSMTWLQFDIKQILDIA